MGFLVGVADLLGDLKDRALVLLFRSGPSFQGFHLGLYAAPVGQASAELVGVEDIKDLVNEVWVNLLPVLFLTGELGHVAPGRRHLVADPIGFLGHVKIQELLGLGRGGCDLVTGSQ